MTANSEYMKYLLAARQRFEAGQTININYINAVYARAAANIKQDILNITPGTLRHGHQTALQAALDRASKQMTQELLDGTHKGIYRATAVGTLPAQNYTQSITSQYWGTAEVRRIFAEVNERAVLALLNRTYDGVKLSDRIWQATFAVKRKIRILVEDAVVRGLPAKTLAQNVQQYLTPGKFTVHKAEVARRLGISKNVSYEGMRLARTEINNAYHEGCIMGSRQIPGYEGIYWRLSPQHKVPDVCDDYAAFTGHGGTEPGFYRAGSEPFRPHPQCMCYTYAGLPDPSVMADRLRGWVKDPTSDPGLERWFQGVKQFLPRPSAAGFAGQVLRRVGAQTQQPGAVGQHKTLTEAQQWAEAKYPHIQFDFVGAHIDVINPTLAEFDRLAQIYPGVVNRLNYVGTHWSATGPYGSGYVWSNAYAHASNNGRYIGLNPKWYGDKTSLLNSLRHGNNIGWSPKMLDADLIRSIMTHEFGHQVSNFYDAVAWIIIDLGNTAQERDILRQHLQGWEQGARGKHRVSEYAKKNDAENWAETFAAAELGIGAVKPITKLMKETLAKLMSVVI